MLLINKDELNQKIKIVRLQYPNLHLAYIVKDILIDYILPIVKDILDNESKISCFEICGGTCLSKFYNLTNRLSEDIDITIYSSSKEQGKQAIKSIEQNIDKKFADYILQKSEKWGEQKTFTSFLILLENEQFSMDIKSSVIVHTEKQIESINLCVSNLYQKIIKEKTDFVFPCAELNKILIDKIIAFENKSQSKITTRITRHIYDIYMILQFFEINNKLNFLHIINQYKNLSELEKKEITNDIHKSKIFNLNKTHLLYLEQLISLEVYSENKTKIKSKEIQVYLKKIKNKMRKSK